MGAKLETKNVPKSIKCDLGNSEFDMLFIVREPYEGGPGEARVQKKKSQFCRCDLKGHVKHFLSIFVKFWGPILSHFVSFWRSFLQPVFLDDFWGGGGRGQRHWRTPWNLNMHI